MHKPLHHNTLILAIGHSFIQRGFQDSSSAGRGADMGSAVFLSPAVEHQHAAAL